MERLKKLWAKALRKVGVSIHDRIFTIKINSKFFADILAQRRTAIITPWDWEFETGGLVRLREFIPDTYEHKDPNNIITWATGPGVYGREAYLFINEIIGPNDTSCLVAGYCVLVLG
jgi:hypothetical protein